MKFSLRLILFGVLNLVLSTSCIFAYAEMPRYQITGFAQGTSFSISYYATKPLLQKVSIDSLFKQIDNSLSLYDSNSLISKFNISANELTIDKHFQSVFRKSRHAYYKSHKQFDPTITPLLELWGLGKAKPQDAIISIDQIKLAQGKMGFEKVQFRNPKLIKSNPDIQLNFNGIAQGYTVDVICKYLNQLGIKSYIVELGGEVRVKGKKPDGTKYQIGVEAPAPYQAKGFVTAIVKGALTSSGIYTQGRMYQGRWISHIINPKTGYPVEGSVLSATVYAKHAVWADAYDQVFLAMEPKDALAFAQSKLKIGLLVYFLDQEGNIQAIYNRRFQKILIN